MVDLAPWLGLAVSLLNVLGVGRGLGYIIRLEVRLAKIEQSLELQKAG
jgi:hypothetical protein